MTIDELAEKFSKLCLTSDIKVGDVIRVDRGKYQAPYIVRVSSICKENVRKESDIYYVTNHVNNPYLTFKVHFNWFKAGIAHLVQ